MRARRFQAPTVSDAYEQVRAALGDDAIIISTRNATTPGMLGFGAREFVEVVAGIPEDTDLNRSVPLRPLTQDTAAHDLVRGLAEAAARADVTPDATLAPPFVNTMAGTGRGPFDAIVRSPSEPGVRLPAPEPAPPIATDQALLNNLAAGLQEVRDLLGRLAQERVDASVEGGLAPLAELRHRLSTQGVRPSLLLSVFDEVAAAISSETLADRVAELVGSSLASKLPPAVSLDLSTRPHAIFIVGPSGAGKTTAAVRLGMQFVQQGLRVVIAGTDVDRAGAPQQLQAFGGAAGLTVRACYSPGEVQTLIASGEADVVIVDTVGHNGARPDRMAELGAYMQIARTRTVLLALPATMQGEDLGRLTLAYAAVHPAGLLLTRCDETETFGGLLSAVEQSGIGIAFTTHDDSVRDPARPGDSQALAAAVLAGRWPDAIVAPRARRSVG